MAHTVSYEKSYEGYLKSKTVFNFDEYNLYQTIHLVMEYSFSPHRYGRILESKIIEHFNLEKSLTKDFDATISNKRGRIEIKTSILNVHTNRYNINYLRSFKNFDYYLFALCDPRKGFKFEYFLIPKKYIEGNPNIKFHKMNSGGESEKISFKDGDETYKLFKRLNILSDVRYYIDNVYHQFFYDGEYALMMFIENYDKFTHVVEQCDYDHINGLKVPSKKWSRYKTPLTINASRKILLRNRQIKEIKEQIEKTLVKFKSLVPLWDNIEVNLVDGYAYFDSGFISYTSSSTPKIRLLIDSLIVHSKYFNYSLSNFVDITIYRLLGHVICQLERDEYDGKYLEYYSGEREWVNKYTSMYENQGCIPDDLKEFIKVYKSEI